jgi:hypothetical protein
MSKTGQAGTGSKAGLPELANLPVSFAPSSPSFSFGSDHANSDHWLRLGSDDAVSRAVKNADLASTINADHSVDSGQRHDSSPSQGNLQLKTPTAKVENSGGGAV